MPDTHLIMCIYLMHRDNFMQVYLCDDGGDHLKRKWVQSKANEKGCDIAYVSGRKRMPGEMNGKSANLNNCLRGIYPGDKAVPPNELVCIFDADQVANKDFYTKTIPLFDAGELTDDTCCALLCT